MSWVQRMVNLFLFLGVLLSPFEHAGAVKHESFKTCAQSGFCKRNRAYADKAASGGSSWASPYNLDPKTISARNGQLQGTILKKVGQDASTIRLPLIISFLESDVVRVIVDEERRQKGDIELRHGSRVRKERYNEVANWAIVGQIGPNKKVAAEIGGSETIVRYGPDMRYNAIIRHSPFAIDFVRDGQTHVKFNGRGLMNVEHWRPKLEKDDQEGEQPAGSEDESTWWEESFGGNTDSKPKGPESVGLDITFPEYEHVFGIPSHASPLSLKETRGGYGNYEDPYRLYNTDVFEYETDSPMTLYGAIPFMQAHRKDSTVGVFWLNAAETWIDIVKSKTSSNPLSLGIGATTDTHTHWFSESGLLDVFVFLDSSPKDIIKTYSDLTGYTQLPPLFGISYHQCRWNYVTDSDVKDVDRRFDRHHIPFDVIWLDIEYTDGKKYFTWDSHNFPDPLSMQQQLDSRGRKLVVIIDPHIKNEAGYHVADQLKSQSLFIKNKDNDIFDGWCWPGSSYWVDCFNPLARKWWASLFAHDSFPSTSPNVHVWNDMNEPSVFNGPETTMPKDNIHYRDWEHRDIHNLNGLTFHNATYHALLAREPARSARRPFVLTRSFYAGSQRISAMWTGDNQASWPHLAASIPMLLSQNIAGYPFAGADVGGFFGNPSKELLTRWYQAGVFYPFMRAHAHIDTRRREPYLIGEPYTRIITQALRLRYSLLPTWYTAFREASVSGAPIIRPHYYTHPADSNAFALDDQFFVGGTGLLVKPVVTEGAQAVNIYLPAGETYFDYFDYTIHHGAGDHRTIPAPLHTIPLLMRQGHIFPRKDRPRRSSALMRWDPYTLVVVLAADGTAEGELYIDDGDSFEYKDGAYIHRRFAMAKSILTSAPADAVVTQPKTAKASKSFAKLMEPVRVARIVLVNVPPGWEGKTEVLVKEEGQREKKKVGFRYEKPIRGRASWGVVRDPGVGVGRSWSVEF